MALKNIRVLCPGWHCFEQLCGFSRKWALCFHNISLCPIVFTRISSIHTSCEQRVTGDKDEKVEGILHNEGNRRMQAELVMNIGRVWVLGDLGTWRYTQLLRSENYTVHTFSETGRLSVHALSLRGHWTLWTWEHVEEPFSEDWTLDGTPNLWEWALGGTYIPLKSAFYGIDILWDWVLNGSRILWDWALDSSPIALYLGTWRFTHMLRLGT